MQEMLKETNNDIVLKKKETHRDKLERGKGESFEEYKERRKIEKKFLKFRKRGYLFWDSFNLGTYRNLE